MKTIDDKTENHKLQSKDFIPLIGLKKYIDRNYPFPDGNYSLTSVGKRQIRELVLVVYNAALIYPIYELFR